jgi:aarF domain-containing kinase
LTAETSQQNDGPKAKPPQSNKAIKYLIALSILGAGAVVYSDEIKHAYHAAGRSGRVVGTLAVCINE